MECYPKNFQKHPLKLYIQDIFRAKRTPENRYIYELFGLTFKNVMIHGVVTSVYNKMGPALNLELSDPTGLVQVYYNTSKSNQNIPLETLKCLHRDFAGLCRFGDENIDIKLKMLNAVTDRNRNPINFEEGTFVKIVGDIFVDNEKNVRMISAYDCKVTSVQQDIVWLEELKYLYEKFYLWIKENSL